MYGHLTTTTTISSTTGTLTPRVYSDGSDNYPSPDVITPSLFPSQPSFSHLTVIPPPFDHHYLNHQQYIHPFGVPAEFDSVNETLKSVNSETGNTSSGCSSVYNSPSPLATQPPSLMQRSISSHNGFFSHLSCGELVDTNAGHVRRVFSTGDLHRRQRHGEKAESPLSIESSLIIEAMNRVSRYSPEEKKERIERYKNKRYLRNFNKKIKYVCRKTLADSRPRIRGRFARNDEIIEKNPQVEWNQIIMGEEDEDEDENWINFIESFSANQLLNI